MSLVASDDRTTTVGPRAAVGVAIHRGRKGELQMEKTWKPVTSGVLSIVAGSLSVTAGLVIALLGGVLSGILAAAGVPGMLSLIPFPVEGGIATPLFILGAMAIVGGSYSIRRRVWPMALAGAICALFPPQVGILGILAIVFVVLGKDEFD